MNRRISTIAVALLIISVVYAACAAPAAAPAAPVTAPTEASAAAPAAQASNLLQTVKDRGVLNCGANGALPGFGFVDPDGNFAGFDIDFCRAVAAAVLGDSTAVEFRALTAGERFTALQSGEVDILIRNTTNTLTRDSSEVGLEFLPTNFYDGQGIMVRKSLEATGLEDLDGATVCVQSGTTTELNLADAFRAAGVEFEPVVFDDADATRIAYDEGRCDAFTTDKSGLVASQTQLTVPDDHMILDVTMSKEPLAGSVLQGDPQWADAARWTINGLIEAEEYGITSANVDDLLSSEDPVIRRLLGVEGELGAKLGLSNDFLYQALSQVGNYGEIYDRNLGPETPFNLPRGLNAQYYDGGILYAPPFR